ncbi:excalibur calcium-binding domain-containing protein [Streptomyces sp. SP18ES09]|uniref:excalibur calcium-binding domain-containing protein n=1 Tax=Streptomyces sp. SP18ES09 TaxID=3002532 RepID=UPI002E790C0C|nr:excalibur calcium-binding domain-containing protein [Streptomyces sp. SP18ES09]
MGEEPGRGAVRVERWWRRSGTAVLCLVLLPPLGVFLAWRCRWPVGRKVTATVLSCVWFVAVGTGGPPADGPAAADTAPKPRTLPSFTPYAPPTPTPTPLVRRVVADYAGQNLEAASRAAYEAGFRARSHDATEDDRTQLVDGNWKVCFQDPVAGATATIEEGRRARIEFAVVEKSSPCPARDGEAVVFPRVPHVVGRTFAAGSAVLRKAGLTEILGVGASTDVDLAARHEDWPVCFQDPEADEAIERPASMTVRLSLTRPGVPCPAEDHARLHPEPDPAPDSGRHGSGSGSGSGGGGLVHYKNCDAVRAAGRAPILAGQPGYRPGLDRDGDGKACDWS